jgi:hypothetical protein
MFQVPVPLLVLRQRNVQSNKSRCTHVGAPLQDFPCASKVFQAWRVVRQLKEPHAQPPCLQDFLLAPKWDHGQLPKRRVEKLQGHLVSKNQAKDNQATLNRMLPLLEEEEKKNFKKIPSSTARQPCGKKRTKKKKKGKSSKRHQRSWFGFRTSARRA